jgi:hypothetical protein
MGMNHHSDPGDLQGFVINACLAMSASMYERAK